MSRFEIAAYSLLILFFLLAYAGRKSSEQVNMQSAPDSAQSALVDTAKAVIKSPFKGRAYPALFGAAFHDSSTAIQKGITFVFKVRRIGNLKIESGIVGACDPINMPVASGFAQQFPIGGFAVELAMVSFFKDERVAFSRVIFSRNPVVKWQLATLPGQQPLTLTDSITYCYPVDSGTGVFGDKIAMENFATKGQAVWDKVFTNNAELNKYSGALYSFDGHNLAIFSTGFGDGCYSSYIGYDGTGSACQLLTDFEILRWQ